MRQAYTSLDAEKGFRVIDNSVESDSASPRICIQFSEPLVASRMDYGHFVTLDGRSAAAIEVEDRQLCVAGVAHGERYRVALRPGLPAAIGVVLVVNTVVGFVTERWPPAVVAAAGAVSRPS